MDTHSALVAAKNDWLHQQVEVDYPTKESLKGRELYFSRYNSTQLFDYDQISASANFIAENIFKVDFHRLTVMFSLLQSTLWPASDDQELIVEFLSQIIYAAPCDLYLAFEQGTPVAAAIVTCVEGRGLISDIATHVDIDKHGFVVSLAEVLAESGVEVQEVEL